jgi:hypothetical protein
MLSHPSAFTRSKNPSLPPLAWRLPTFALISRRLIPGFGYPFNKLPVLKSWKALLSFQHSWALPFKAFLLTNAPLGLPDPKFHSCHFKKNPVGLSSLASVAFHICKAVLLIALQTFTSKVEPPALLGFRPPRLSRSLARKRSFSLLFLPSRTSLAYPSQNKLQRTSGSFTSLLGSLPFRGAGLLGLSHQLSPP